MRQIRLAAAVRKTVTQSGKGGSNPLTCTKVFRVSRIWGGEAAHLAALIRQSSHVRIVPPERLCRLRIGRLPVEEYGASLNLAVAASFTGVRQAGLADALSRHHTRRIAARVLPRHRRQDRDLFLSILPDDLLIR